MAVPDFQTFLLPFLKALADGKPKTISEMRTILAAEFKLTPEDLAEMLPSGRVTRFMNRVGWAKTYLQAAKLIESVGRGTFQITKRGTDVLRQSPKRIDIRFLEQFPEFLEFRSRGGAGDTKAEEKSLEPNKETPEESLEKNYLRIREPLVTDLIDHVLEGSPEFFERLVVELLLRMGYGGSRKEAGTAVGKTGDGGIDGIIKEDKLGLDVIYLQAKRWRDTVGSAQLREFVGSLEANKAQKGVFITTSKFSSDAKDFVTKVGKKIVLIDGARLGELMVDHNLGVVPVASYEVKRVDSDFFTEE